jgi:hypothetical protein
MKIEKLYHDHSIALQILTELSSLTTPGLLA